MKKLENLRKWIVLALVLLAVAHWFYWYQPRPREAAPNLEDAPAQILFDEDFPFAVWIPYPHQNLAALGRLGTSPQELASATAALGEVEAPALPSFGPFPAPPARELVLAADPESDHFLVAARVYPGLTAFARLAGWMARNPWLRGGDVELRNSRVEIRWQGTLWSARAVPKTDSPSKVSGGAAMAVPPGLPERALALARTGGRMSFLPAGWYRLSALGRGRRLQRLSGSEAGERAQERLDGLDGLFTVPLLSGTVALVAVQEQPSEGRRGLGLFTSESGGESTGFAVLSDGPARKLPLTGLGLAVLLGDRGYSGIASGWSLLATSELSFRQGAYLVPPLREGLDTSRSHGEPLELALAGRPEGALAVLEELAGRLATLGPVAHRERLRLLALQELLMPLSAYDQIRLVVAADRRSVLLELVPR
ncbi:MAG: hypothetical protein KDD47_05105 [Acidobacteria bacterium]|nr:hypothetical protein [Acidobacteriota bacterium]